MRNVVHHVQDVQVMVRAMRDSGLNVRYMCAGEFGEKFGRVHWHFVGFWRGQCPDVPLERRIEWKFWPHGYSFFQKPDYQGLAYALKYAVKDSAPGSVRPFLLSKKPPIGCEWLLEQARDLARAGLPLHAPTYQFRNVKDAQGKVRTFWLQGKMRELFVREYIGQWGMQYVTGADIKPSVPVTDFLFGEVQRLGKAAWRTGGELRKIGLGPGRADSDASFAALVAELDRRRPKVYADPHGLLHGGYDDI